MSNEHELDDEAKTWLERLEITEEEWDEVGRRHRAESAEKARRLFGDRKPFPYPDTDTDA